MSTSAVAVASPVQVVLALHNELQRFGVERMLQAVPGVESVQVTSYLTDAVDLAGDHRDGVLIVSLREIDEEAAEQLRTTGEAGVKILVLVDEGDVADLSRLASTGSSGFLMTSELSASTLDDTLTRMRGGEVPMSAGLTRALLSMARASVEEASLRLIPLRLTLRECQALVLLVDGLSNKQIGRRLEISEHGAKRLVTNILAKLGCTSRTSAVSKVLREGIYDECLRRA